MVIKSDKEVRHMGIFAIVGVVVVSICMYLKYNDIIFAVLAFVLSECVAVRGWISTDRTLVMDEEG